MEIYSKRQQLISKLLAVVFFGSLVIGQFGSFTPFTSTAVMYIHDITISILVGYHVFSFAHTSPRLRLPIIGFTVVALLSLITNLGRFDGGEIATSSLYLIRWIVYTGVYFVVLASPLPRTFWLWGLLVTGSILSTFGFVQFVLYPDLRNMSYLGWDPYYFRLFSTLLDPNFFGLISIFTIFIGIYIYSLYQKIFWLGLLITYNFAALLLTFSRGSFLAFGVAIVLYVMLMKKWLVFLLFFCASMIFFVLPKPEFEAFDLARNTSAMARVGNWQRAFGLINESPITGLGFNTLRIVAEQKGWIHPIDVSRGGIIDSSLLFVWATTGVFGVIAYIYIAVKISMQGLTAFRNKHTKQFGAICLSIFIAAVVHSVFTNSLFYPWIMIWMWIVVGVLEKTLSGKQLKNDPAT